MDWPTILLLSVGLAMDAFSVSVCSGMVLRSGQILYAVRMAVFFGAFQTFMPVFGWLGGSAFSGLIAQYDHWVAFALLALIGGKLLWESLRQGGACETAVDVTRLRVLMVLALATSIDALAVGLSFAFLQVSIVLPVLVIGLVTFSLSLLGSRMGQHLDIWLQTKSATVGGLVLIGIGVRILVQHLMLAAPASLAAWAGAWPA